MGGEAREKNINVFACSRLKPATKIGLTPSA
jgi:hypothetical protein